MATNVAELCTLHQITIPELARRSGLDEGRVLAIVLGRWTPSPQERRQVAESLQVPVTDIIWGHKTPVQHIYGY